jgi:hypothetical protein
MHTKRLLPIIILMVSIGHWHNLSAQITENKALTERLIDRPLTLHKKHLEVDFAYRFGSLLSITDPDGKKINISEAGIAASSNLVNLRLTYGISERLQVQSVLSYYSHKKTTETIVQKGISSKLTQIFGIITTKGILDPEVRVNYLLLDNNKKISLSIGAGISIPLAKYKPEYPKIDSIGEEILSSYQYTLNQPNGTGVPVYNVNLVARYRLGSLAGTDFRSKISLRLLSDFYTVPTTVSTNNWLSVFDAGNPLGFTFQDYPIKHKVGDWAYNRLFIDYQAFNIAMFSFGVTNRQYYHGWEESKAMKIAEYDVSETSLVLGAQIQVSPKLRINELITLPVSGKGLESFFTCQFSIIYKILQ